MKKYEFLEHTADLRVRLYGNSLKDLFITSAKTLFSVLSNHHPKKNRACTFKLKAGNSEELLIIWLNELLSRFYANKFLPGSFDIKITKKNISHLTCKLKGELIDFKKTKILHEIKAATHHDLKINVVNKRYIAEIILDV